MREALPIKCLEAVVLGLHLTSGMKEVSGGPHIHLHSYIHAYVSCCLPAVLSMQQLFRIHHCKILVCKGTALYTK